MRDRRGFTLAELLVAVAVLALVLVGVFLLQQQGQQAYLAGANRVEAQQNARVALELINRELRAACSIVATPPTATTVRFTIVSGSAASNLDCTTATGADLLTVEYTLSGTTLVRLSAAGALPTFSNCTAMADACLIGGVDGLTFTYLDAANASLVPTVANTANIRSVNVTLRTKSEDPVVSATTNVPVNLQSRVRLRNL